MGNFEHEFMMSRPYECEECGGKRMIFKGGGSYECANCGHIMLDAFGKVKEFLDENGGTQPMLVISEATGVSVSILEKLLKDGRLQFPPDSKVFLKCEKCGCAIRSGRFCPSCSIAAFQGINEKLSKDVTEKAKKQSVHAMDNLAERRGKGKLRFMGKELE